MALSEIPGQQDQPKNVPGSLPPQASEHSFVLQTTSELQNAMGEVKRGLEILTKTVDKIDERLKSVEIYLAKLDTKFETELKYLATKAWILGGLLGGMGMAAMIGIGLARLFSS